MKHEANIPEFDNAIPPEQSSVSIYGQDAMDDFPVLKAFQQYIDAEQEKARKRLLAMGIFFSVLMLAVIAVFVVLLLNVTSRNQQLNDKLVELALKQSQEKPASVVVQPPPQQDSKAINDLTDKLETMHKDLVASLKRVDEVSANAARNASEEAAAKAKGPTPEELEIKRLKDLLTNERKAAAEEKEKRRQEELEAYRRKYYPEFYRKKEAPKRRPVVLDDDDDLDLDDDDAISYFDDIDEDDEPIRIKSRPTSKTPVKKTVKAQPKTQKAEKAPVQPKKAETAPAAVKKPAPAPLPAPVKKDSIPLDVGGSNTKWLVPND